MQYWHRRLHLSVTDNRRLRSGLRHVSRIATPEFYRVLLPLPPGEGRGEGEIGATETGNRRATTSSRPAGPGPIGTFGSAAEVPRRPEGPCESVSADPGRRLTHIAAWPTRSASNPSEQRDPRFSRAATAGPSPLRRETQSFGIPARPEPAPAASRGRRCPCSNDGSRLPPLG